MCMEIGVHWHRWSQGNFTKKRRMKASQRFPLHLVWILFQATSVKKVWPQCSKSACSQVSAALFYARSVWAQICADDMCVSRLHVQAKVSDTISVKTSVWQLPDVPIPLALILHVVWQIDQFTIYKWASVITGLDYWTGLLD